jgi:hypothetical protein
MSNRSDPTGALLLGIGAGLLVFYRGFRQFREYKLVSDTPRINIRSVPMGFVQVRGQAEPAKLLTSPVSKTPCCFYRVEIEHWKEEDRGGLEALVYGCGWLQVLPHRRHRADISRRTRGRL